MVGQFISIMTRWEADCHDILVLRGLCCCRPFCMLESGAGPVKHFDVHFEDRQTRRILRGVATYILSSTSVKLMKRWGILLSIWASNFALRSRVVCCVLQGCPTSWNNPWFLGIDSRRQEKSSEVHPGRVKSKLASPKAADAGPIHIVKWLASLKPKLLHHWHPNVKVSEWASEWNLYAQRQPVKGIGEKETRRSQVHRDIDKVNTEKDSDNGMTWQRTTQRRKPAA